jgi:hypothetical protein
LEDFFAEADRVIKEAQFCLTAESLEMTVEMFEAAENSPRIDGLQRSSVFA